MRRRRLGRSPCWSAMSAWPVGGFPLRRRRSLLGNGPLFGNQGGEGFRAAAAKPGAHDILTENGARAPAANYVGEHEPDLEDMMMHDGLDSDRVGRIVADAIGPDRFWLFTHPEMRDRVAERAVEMDRAMQDMGL